MATTGQIEDVWHARSSYMTVSFLSAEGETVVIERMRRADFSRDQRVGDSLEVVYDSADPRRAGEAGMHVDWVELWLFAPAGLLCSAVGGWHLGLARQATVRVKA